MNETTVEQRDDDDAAALLHRARWIVFEEFNATPDALVAAVFHQLATRQADREAMGEPADTEPVSAPRVLH